MSKKNRPVGVVYSTNPDYQYQYDNEPEAVTLAPEKQRLRVSLDRHHRGGKTVTLVTGVGGSAKDGEIIIQGDQQEKVRAALAAAGYRC